MKAAVSLRTGLLLIMWGLSLLVSPAQDQGMKTMEKQEAVDMVKGYMPQIQEVVDKLANQLDQFQQKTEAYKIDVTPNQMKNVNVLSGKFKAMTNSGFFFIYKGRKGLMSLVAFMIYYEPGNYMNTKAWILNPFYALNDGIAIAINFKTDETPIIFADGLFKEGFFLVEDAKPFYLIGIDCTIKPPVIGGLPGIGPLVYTEIDDFTLMANCKLTGSSSLMGGAIVIRGGNMMFLGNEIYGNNATLMGGGVLCMSYDSAAAPMLIGNFIHSNHAPKGGGIAFNKDNGTLAAMNVIRSNQANDNGGGIFLDASRSYILVNHILNNQTTVVPSDGGGISLHLPKTAIVTGNFIINNTCHGSGAGIHCKGKDNIPINIAVIALNYIENNHTPFRGGGAAFENDANAVFLGNIVMNNTAPFGAGVSCWETAVGILANTITGNTAGDSSQPGLGGGLYLHEVKGLVSANTVIGNHAYFGGGIYYEDPSKQNLDYPIFAMNQVQGNLATWGAGVYIWGNNEPEFYYNSVFRNIADSSGGGFFLTDGTHPHFVSNNIYSNIAYRHGGGIYSQGNGTNPDIGSAGSASAGNRFQNNSALLGGALFYTNGSIPLVKDNHFYNNRAYNGGAIFCDVDGGSIRSNFFDWNKATNNGGAIFVNVGMSPLINGNTFQRNIGGAIASKSDWLSSIDTKGKGNGDGGAIFTAGVAANPEITENFLKWNVSNPGHGGGIAIEDGSKPIVRRNVYESNFAGYATKDAGMGGALYISGCDIAVREEVFVTNVAFNGGAIAMNNGSKDTLLSNIFLINIADKDSSGEGLGGGCYIHGQGSAALIGSPIEPNFFKYNTSSFGGAIGAETDAHVIIQADTFISNQAGYFTGAGDGGAIFLRNGVTGIVGGNGPDSLGNVFMQNTSGLPKWPGLANGGAIAVHDQTLLDIKGNIFSDHNACTHSGGAVYLKGQGVMADIGGENDDEIIHHPFQEKMWGNIIQNNNNSLVFPFHMPFIPWPTDSIAFPDTLELDSLTVVPTPPDTIPTYISTPVTSIPLIVTIVDDPYNGINRYAFISQGKGGVLATDVTSLFTPIVLDTIPSLDYAYDLLRVDSILYVSDGAAGIRVFNLSPLYTSGSSPVLKFSKVVNCDLMGMAYDDVNGVIFSIGSDSLIHRFKVLPHMLVTQASIQPPMGGIFTHIVARDGILYATISYDAHSEFVIYEILPVGVIPAFAYMVDGLITALAVNDEMAILGTSFSLGDQRYASIRALDIYDHANITEIAGIPNLMEAGEYYSSVGLGGPFIYIGANLGLISFNMFSGYFTFNLTENPVIYIKPMGVEVLASLGNPAMQIISPPSGMVMGSVPAIQQTETMTIPWPSYIDFPPDSGWMPSFPVIPDTLIVGNDTIVPGQGFKISPSPSWKMPPIIAKASTDTTLIPMNDSIVTQNGGFLAIVEDANALVRGNLIGGSDFNDANTASHFGGAIYVYSAGDTVVIGVEDNQAAPEHYRNYIQGNVGRWGGGIAIDNHQAAPVLITNNLIGGHLKLEGNMAREWGGGVFAQQSNLSLHLNQIIRNYAGFDTIPSDTVHGFGGAVALMNCHADIWQNWMIRNTSAGNGGGIGLMADNSRIRISQNTLTENNGLTNMEPRGLIINGMVKADRPVPGLGDEIFISKFSKAISVTDSCLIRNNVIDHLGSFEAAAIYSDTSLLQDTSRIRIENNVIYSIIGKLGERTFNDEYLIQRNFHSKPLYTDVFAGNYSLGSSYAYPQAGWNPFSGAGVMGNSTYTVPGDYLSIGSALAAALPGDRIMVHKSYRAENDSFPIVVPSGLAITGMAFVDTLDLNITDSTLVEGSSGYPVFVLDSTHCRTLLAGLKISGGSRGLSLQQAEGYVLSNIICNNDSMDLSIQFEEVSPLNFHDRLYFDHNTVTMSPLIVYANTDEHAGVFYDGDVGRNIAGPLFGYNILDLGVRGSLFAYAPHKILPAITVGLEMNNLYAHTEDTIPQVYTSYDTVLVVASSQRNLSINPSFVDAGNWNFHLDKGSPCLLGVDSTYCIIQNGQCIIGFDSSCVCEVVMISGPDTLIRYDTIWHCLYGWDTTMYSRLIGAQYAWLSAMFTMDTALGCTPLSVTFMPDVYYADPSDSLYYRWAFSSGDTIFGDTIIHVFTNAGLYDVELEVRGRYSRVYDLQEQAIRVGNPPVVFAGHDTTLFVGDSIFIQAGVTGDNPPFLFLWSPGTGLSDSVVLQPIAKPLQTTDYLLQVTDAMGCSTLDSLSIHIIQELMTISGRVFYLNQDSTPIDTGYAIIATVGKQAIDSVMLDPAGVFSFDSLWGDYLLYFKINENWGGANATDALRVAMHYVDISHLTGLYFKAGDVNLSGFLNAADALLILKRFCQLESSFQAPDWIIPAIPVISSLDSAHPYIPVGVLCAGDVNGSYDPSIIKKSGVYLERDMSLLPYSDRTISLVMREPKVVGSISLILEFSYPEIQVSGIEIPFSEVDPVYRLQDGRLYIAWYSLNPIYVDEGDVLVNITLHSPLDPKASIQLKALPGSVLSDNHASSYKHVDLGYVLPNNLPTSEFWLGQNHPNPAYQVTSIDFSLPGDGFYNLCIVDAMGRAISVVAQGNSLAGRHRVSFSTLSLEAGVYLYRLQYQDANIYRTEVRKMMISK